MKTKITESEKIKALLASPAVESVKVTWSDYYPESYFCMDLDSKKEFDLNLRKLGKPVRMETVFHQWPELEVGDLVMTIDGEGEVCASMKHDIFEIHLFDIIEDNSLWRWFSRHELALLAKGES